MQGVGAGDGDGVADAGGHLVFAVCSRCVKFVFCAFFPEEIQTTSMHDADVMEDEALTADAHPGPAAAAGHLEQQQHLRPQTPRQMGSNRAPTIKRLNVMQSRRCEQTLIAPSLTRHNTTNHLPHHPHPSTDLRHPLLSPMQPTTVSSSSPSSSAIRRQSLLPPLLHPSVYDCGDGKRTSQMEAVGEAPEVE